jgi:hypothetical protein
MPRTIDAYQVIADHLLKLKAAGHSPEQLAEAIARAASETGVRRWQISDAYDALRL